MIFSRCTTLLLLPEFAFARAASSSWTRLSSSFSLAEAMSAVDVEKQLTALGAKKFPRTSGRSLLDFLGRVLTDCLSRWHSKSSNKLSAARRCIQLSQIMNLCKFNLIFGKWKIAFYSIFHIFSPKKLTPKYLCKSRKYCYFQKMKRLSLCICFSNSAFAKYSRFL